MLIIGHTAIGVGIGLLFPNPILAFFVGVISHHLADWTPHFDAGSYYSEQELIERRQKPTHFGAREWAYVIGDGLITLGMLTVFATKIDATAYAAVATGIVGANLPDLAHNVPFWSRWVRSVGWMRYWQDEIHRRFQSTVQLKHWYWGILTQLIVIGAVAWLVFK